MPPTDSQAQNMSERILATLSKSELKTLIIDVSALELIDSYLTRIFYDIAHGARTLGVESALVGIQPSVAITLVQMGLGNLNIRTFLNLDDAMRALRRRP